MQTPTHAQTRSRIHIYSNSDNPIVVCTGAILFVFSYDSIVRVMGAYLCVSIRWCVCVGVRVCVYVFFVRDVYMNMNEGIYVCIC